MVQQAPNESEGRVAPIPGAAADVVDGRKRGQVLGPHALAQAMTELLADQLVFQQRKAARHRRAGADRNSRGTYDSVRMLQNGGDHDDRDDQVLSRSEFQEIAARGVTGLRHEQRADKLVRPAGRLA